MKSLSFAFIPMLIVVCFSCSQSLNRNLVTASVEEAPVKSAAELRQELAERESASPIAYLSITRNIHKNKVLIQKPDLFHHSVYQTDGYIIERLIRRSRGIYFGRVNGRKES